MSSLSDEKSTESAIIPVNWFYKNGAVEDIFLKYINILAEAIQINYNKTSSPARSIVCSDVVSNIFIVMLKRGDNTLDTIDSTCTKAATLYTESLFLLEYCLSEIKLKQITDIKRFVYLKTIGSYEITPTDTLSSSVEMKNISKSLFMVKDVIQHLIHCTIEKKAELSTSKLMMLLTNLHKVMLNGGTEFVVAITRDIILHINDAISSTNYTTEDMTSLLIQNSIRCMIYNFIYDQIQDNEVTYFQFNDLQFDIKYLSPSDNDSICTVSDLYFHPMYINTMKQLLENDIV